MAKYYVKVVGRAFGPIDAEKIVQMVADGKLTRESEVSANRLDWRTIGEVDELRQALSVGLPTAAPFNGAGIGASDAKVWYVTNDGVTQYGPMTQDEVLRALQSGQIQPTASAWRDGEQARPISDIPAFRTQNVAPVEKKEWYYSPDGQTGYGPYGVSDILAFVEQGRANFDTLVWRLGENSRPMRNEPVFTSAYNAGHGGMVVAGTNPLTPYGSNNSDSHFRKETDKLNVNLRRWHNLMWISFVACWGALFIVLVLVVTSLFFGHSILDFLSAVTKASILTPILIGLLFTPLYIFSLVPHYVFIYNFWKSIPQEFARTTPGKAVGFMLIPFFNLYWYFVAFYHGSKDIDKALSEYVQQGRNRGERPCYTGSVGGLIAAICFVLLLAHFLPIIFYFCTISMKNAAIQLNNWRSVGAMQQSPVNAGPRVTLDDLIRS